MNNPDNHPCYDDSIGWYTPGGGGDNMENFASYLHNPYALEFLNEKQKCTVEHFMKLDKYQHKLLYTLVYFFGDRTKNEKEGLTKQFNSLKNNIVKNKMIGMVLWGANGNNVSKEVSVYTTHNNNDITLTTNSICATLINDYITPEKLDSIC